MTWFSDDPIAGDSVLCEDNWFVYQAGKKNWQAKIRMSSRTAYEMINSRPLARSAAILLEGIMPGTSASDFKKVFLWNPKYNALILIEDIVEPYKQPQPVYPNAVRYVEFMSYWEKGEPQCKWWRWFDLSSVMRPVDYETRMIPPVARGFALAHDFLRAEEVPEFKNGEEAYAWAESLLD